MEIISTPIPGLVVIKPDVYVDGRGYFFESFSERRYDEILGKRHFVQDNESRSCKSVIRGLHFQRADAAQAKLIRVVKGCVRDVAVDLRLGSPSFGKAFAVDLSEDNHLQFFIPRGFAHGFSVLSDEAIFQYKCDNYYNPALEAGIAWNDPALDIDWGVEKGGEILSDKDSLYPTLEHLPKEYLFRYEG